jgi:hypothetical protein
VKPTVTLLAPYGASPSVRRALEALLAVACGDCCVIITVATDPRLGRTVYTLSGPWTLRPAEVHHQLAVALGALACP